MPNPLGPENQPSPNQPSPLQQPGPQQPAQFQQPTPNIQQPAAATPGSSENGLIRMYNKWAKAILPYSTEGVAPGELIALVNSAVKAQTDAIQKDSDKVHQHAKARQKAIENDEAPDPTDTEG